MEIDILILNTAVTDLRRAEFDFADKLVGKGGLAKCETKDMPNYTQEQIHQWIQQGSATAGGPGNCAPLMARAGLDVAVGVLLSKGNYETSDSNFKLDAQGKFFYDTMIANSVDMSSTVIHPDLPTGTTFIHEISPEERGGIAYFPNANNDFDFEVFKKHVERLNPKIAYYMYSGLSDKGDANNGQDLANFIKWCRQKGIVTIVDSHTLTGNPQEIIKSGQAVKEYKLLEPILKQIDIFFTSSDEAKMIANTLEGLPKYNGKHGEAQYITDFLDRLTKRYLCLEGTTKLLGVTVGDGAFYRRYKPHNHSNGVRKVVSRFMCGEPVDLVGAGDAFRAGLLTYIANNFDTFRSGRINFREAVQMGNLFASLYIKADLDKRYDDIGPYQNMLRVVGSKDKYTSIEQLRTAVKQP